MSSTIDYTRPTTSGASNVDGAVSRHGFSEAKDGFKFTEAKDGFKTSEFYVMVVFVAAVLLATYLNADTLAREDGWRFAAFAVAAYIISRGLAKLGVRQPDNHDH